MRRFWLAARKRLSGAPLLRNSLTLMSGSFAGQAVVFVASPFLSRIFSLADFGDLANYGAWTTVLALLSNLRYEHALFVTEDEHEATEVMSLTAVLSVLFTVLITVPSVALYMSNPGDGYLEDLSRIALYVPIGIMSVSVASLMTQHHVRTGRFGFLTWVTGLQMAVTALSQILLGVIAVQQALIVGTIVGFLFVAVVLSWSYATTEGLGGLVAGAHPARLLRMARRHFNFPKYALPADGIGVVVQRFVPVLVLAWFTPAAAGMYAFSMRVVRLPLLMLAYPVMGALRKEAADRVREQRTLLPLFGTTTKTLFLLSVVPSLVLLLFSEPLFLLVFGQQWGDAGRIVEILTPGILLEFVAIPCSVFFLVTNKQHVTFALQLLGFFGLVGALWLGRELFSDFVGTCYLLSGVMVIANGVTLFLARTVSRDPPQELPDRYQSGPPDPEGFSEG